MIMYVEYRFLVIDQEGFSFHFTTTEKAIKRLLTDGDISKAYNLDTGKEVKKNEEAA